VASLLAPVLQAQVKLALLWNRMANHYSPDHAGVIAPPPLIYMGGLLLGFFLHLIWPFTLLPPALAQALGLVLVVLFFVFAFPAVRLMRGAGTSLRPDMPTTTLITTGPFRYTRNPIYLAFTSLYVGVSFVLNMLWPLLLLPIVIVVMNRGVITREEAYLEREFGDAYRQYKARVRRWL
jgi:protein-S-isoprenylcysteine O-methyltransferase Ste14